MSDGVDQALSAARVDVATLRKETLAAASVAVEAAGEQPMPAEQQAHTLVSDYRRWVAAHGLDAPPPAPFGGGPKGGPNVDDDDVYN